MELDLNLYSRQIGAYGVETMGKLVQMRVFLVGLRGLGLESAKNLILAGPKSVTLYDPELVQLRDLGSGFYYNEGQVGKISRAEASLDQLKDLNQYVSVTVYQDELTPQYLADNYDIVVFTDYYNLERLIEINEFLRNQQKPIGFIVSGSLGLYGYTFVDFGPSFTIRDANGEEPRSAIISKITQETAGVVTVHEDKRHGFEDGDYVTFREVQGMNEINGQNYKIKVLSPHSFSIGDTSQFSEYSREGIVEQIKEPFNIQFKSLRESLEVPVAPGKDSLELCDWEKIGRPEELHLILRAVFKFYSETQRLPNLNDNEDAEQLFNLTNAINSENKEKMDVEGLIKLDQVNKELVRNVSLFARTTISPLASFWGGIVSQEIVKFTGKFSPLRQWLHYECFEALPENEVNRTQTNTRYDDYVSIFGQDFVTQLSNIRSLLVGAGALGCEFIKMFALMGFASGKGKLTCTDDDNIEISNLNRQFLFRKENVGFPKSQIACQVGRRMNEHFNVEALKMRVAEDTEEQFNDIFWDQLDFVVNAVDNIKARHYIDSRCVFYGKPLFESGTLGTKCNSQIILPHQTQSYGESQDPPEESIPLCTLKNFPYLIEHTIQWARDFFEGVFVEGPKECQNYLENSDKYIEGIIQEFSGRKSTIRTRLEGVKRFSSQFENATHETCIRLARNLFQDIFHDMIAQLLHSFPLDYKTENGVPFWSGPKRAPFVIEFSPDDPIHFEFIVSASNIFANIFNLPYIQDRNYIREQTLKVQVKEFKPKQAVIKVNDNDNREEKTEDDDAVADELISHLKENKPQIKKNLNIFEFEKDDDSNFHIDFIYACANLRARNYKIPEAPRHKIKLIAGKIIPAIATTTAMVVGAVGIEIIKKILNKPVSKFRNLFSNLALPLWLFSEPLPPNQQKDKDYDPILMGPVVAIPPGFTVWDKLTVQGPLTIEQIIKHFRDEYRIQISIISLGKLVIYNQYQKGNEARLKLTPDQIVKEITNTEYPPYKKFIEMEISGETTDMVDCLLPSLKYVMKQ